MSYVPTPTPSDVNALPAYIKKELNNIALSQTSLSEMTLEKTYAEPSKLIDGMIVYADGVHWNPGSGKGMYYYNGSAWALMG